MNEIGKDMNGNKCLVISVLILPDDEELIKNSLHVDTPKCCVQTI